MPGRRCKPRPISAKGGHSLWMPLPLPMMLAVKSGSIGRHHRHTRQPPGQTKARPCGVGQAHHDTCEGFAGRGAGPGPPLGTPQEWLSLQCLRHPGTPEPHRPRLGRAPNPSYPQLSLEEAIEDHRSPTKAMPKKTHKSTGDQEPSDRAGRTRTHG